MSVKFLFIPFEILEKLGIESLSLKVEDTIKLGEDRYFKVVEIDLRDERIYVEKIK